MWLKQGKNAFLFPSRVQRSLVDRVWINLLYSHTVSILGTQVAISLPCHWEMTKLGSAHTFLCIIRDSHYCFLHFIGWKLVIPRNRWAAKYNIKELVHMSRWNLAVWSLVTGTQIWLSNYNYLFTTGRAERKF